jgi:hypothetical protein
MNIGWYTVSMVRTKASDERFCIFCTVTAVAAKTDDSEEAPTY